LTMFKRTYTWLPVQETSQNPSRMGCEWLKNETLLFQCFPFVMVLANTMMNDFKIEFNMMWNVI
jgi:hypothetical protein